MGETNFPEALADKWLDDGKIRDNDGDESFTTGPFGAGFGAIGAGL